MTTHSVVVTETNDPEYPVSADAWNLAHLDPDSVIAYGAEPWAAASQTGAFQAAIDAIVTRGDAGTVFVPRGIYYLDEPVILPTTLAYKLRIIGEPGTVLYPAKSCFTHETPHATCTNVEIGNFHIDASRVTGKHAMIGSYGGTTNAAWGHYTGWQNIHIHDIEVTGLTRDTTYPTSPTHHQFTVGMMVEHTTSDEEETTIIDNILIERVTMDGGNGGILIVGRAGTGTTPNIEIDNIVIRDSSHVIPDGTPPSYWLSSNVQIGQNAKVGRVRIENFYGENAGDDGIEINNSTDCVITRCSIKNTWAAAYYLCNYRATPDSRYVLRDNQHIHSYTDSTDPGSLKIGGSLAYGEVIVDGYRLSSVDMTRMLYSSVEIGNLSIKNVYGDYALAKTITEAWSTSGIVYLKENGAGNHHVMENVVLNVTGTISGAFASTWRGICLAGADVQWTIRNCHQIWAAADDSGTKTFLKIGETGSYVGVLVDRCSDTGSDTKYSHTSNTYDATHLEMAGAYFVNASTVASTNNFSMA
jgi:hypothetical protein